MPCIITTIHDPAVLAETCRRFGVLSPVDDVVVFENEEVSGWIVHLPGLYAPLVFKTLTGLVVYHPRDNRFDRYARIMRFVFRCYDIGASRRRSPPRVVHGSNAPTHRLVFGQEVA